METIRLFLTVHFLIWITPYVFLVGIILYFFRKDIKSLIKSRKKILIVALAFGILMSFFESMEYYYHYILLK